MFMGKASNEVSHECQRGSGDSTYRRGHVVNRGSLWGECLAAIKQQTREGPMLNFIDGGWVSTTDEAG
jgi:hypothetical protein